LRVEALETVLRASWVLGRGCRAPSQVIEMVSFVQGVDCTRICICHSSLNSILKLFEIIGSHLSEGGFITEELDLGD
jgi:hypothetical protein